LRRICIELSDEDYATLEDMLDMFPGRRDVQDLVKDMVRHNIENYRRITAWVRKIIEEVLEKD